MPLLGRLGTSKSILVNDAVYKHMDIGPFMPIIKTPQFQRMLNIKQLGTVYLVYSSALHTRQEHSLGSMWSGALMTRDWIKKGDITEEEFNALCVALLLHDIGHWAYSHTTEAVSSRNHESVGYPIIESLKPQIETVGANFDLVLSICKREHPLSQVAFHRLGAERLDYLARDAHYTNMGCPDVGFVRSNLRFIDGRLVVEERAMHTALSVLQFFPKQYGEVYLRKKSVIAQRVLEWMTHELILLEELNEEQLWSLVDHQLLALFDRSQNPMVQTWAKRLGHNSLPKSTIEIHSSAFERTRFRPDKDSWILTIDEERLRNLLLSEQLQTPDSRRQLEKELSEITGIPFGELFIVPPVFPPRDIEKRYEPEDIEILYDDGFKRSLFDIFPQHLIAFRELGRSFCPLRIAARSPENSGASQDFREILRAKKHLVLGYFIDLLND